MVNKNRDARGRFATAEVAAAARYDLLFSRFLRPDAVEHPSLDLNFAPAERQAMLLHLSENYGPTIEGEPVVQT